MLLKIFQRFTVRHISKLLLWWSDTWDIYELYLKRSGKKPRHLHPHYDYAKVQDNEGNEQDIPVYELSFGEHGDILITVREEDKDDVKSRIGRLLSNPNLNNVVSKYTELKNSLDANQKRLEFFNKIDSLYKAVYLDGNSINKKTKMERFTMSFRTSLIVFSSWHKTGYS